MSRWLGKYRGTVIGTGAPSEPLGSLMVNVPEVMGDDGHAAGAALLPVHRHSCPGRSSSRRRARRCGWSSRAGGPPSRSGWAASSTPAGPAAAKVAPPGTESAVIQTTLGNLISVIDVPGATGGIMLRAATGAMIMVNDTGIVLQDGKGGVLTMTGGDRQHQPAEPGGPQVRSATECPASRSPSRRS